MDKYDEWRLDSPKENLAIGLDSLDLYIKGDSDKLKILEDKLIDLAEDLGLELYY